MNTAMKRSFWTVAAEQLAAERMSKTLLLVAGSIPANDTTAPVKPSKGAKLIEIRNMRGKDWNVDVLPKKSIRLHGIETNTSKPYVFDITFKIGDVAVYGGYNLTYTGTIVSIGEKTVKIKDGDRSTVLKFDDFAFWNRDFDAERIAKSNSDELTRI